MQILIHQQIIPLVLSPSTDYKNSGLLLPTLDFHEYKGQYEDGDDNYCVNNLRYTSELASPAILPQEKPKEGGKLEMTG
jgi:hypothetical protein